MRIKPVKTSGGGLSLDVDEGRVEFITPKASQGWVLVVCLLRACRMACKCRAICMNGCHNTLRLVNNQREAHRFRFDGVFPPDVMQDQVRFTSADGSEPQPELQH